MRILGSVLLAVQLAGCTVADLNGFTSADQAASSPELARVAAEPAASDCLVRSADGITVRDRRGAPVLCQP
jgi:hypothetical protein